MSNLVATKYSLKQRPYLGPTSMDAELSFVMANMAHVKPGHLVFDPFCGTASILVSAAALGARTFGGDIDMLVLKGMMSGNRKKNGNVFTNFKTYGLIPPEIIRFDHATRAIRHVPLFHSIITDPPYGMRAGAKRLGYRRGSTRRRKVQPENRATHIAMTTAYEPDNLLRDLLTLAARSIILGGYLVYVLPISSGFTLADMPRHPCFRLVSVVEEVLIHGHRRLLVCMHKIAEYDESAAVRYDVVVGSSIGHAKEDAEAWQRMRTVQKLKAQEGQKGAVKRHPSPLEELNPSKPMSKRQAKKLRRKQWKKDHPFTKEQRERFRAAKKQKRAERKAKKQADIRAAQAAIEETGREQASDAAGVLTTTSAVPPAPPASTSASATPVSDGEAPMQTPPVPPQ